LFDPCSLCPNRIGAEGAKHIGDSLKINKALTTLECALAAPQLPNALALLSAGRGLTVCGCSLFDPRSLYNNQIGHEGAQHIGEALKSNTVLTMLECVLACMRHSCQMRSLCC
jgi:hypothetical protein